MPYQTDFRGSICPLMHPMRRRKVARKTSSQRVRPLLPQCGRFTLCYGMNPQRAILRKTAQIFSLIMFERIPRDQRLINIITDDRQTRSVHELNVFVSRPDASGGIDSLETVARRSMTIRCEITRKRVSRETHLVGNTNVWLRAKIPFSPFRTIRNRL